MSRRKKCLLLHKWAVAMDNGVTRYFECLKCGKRKHLQVGEGYQPINQNWLAGKTNDFG